MLVTVRKAAALLGTSEHQVYRWVDEGEIPFHRVRGQVRFNRTELLEWVTERGLPVAVDAFEADSDPDEHAVALSAALRVGGVHHDVNADTREAVLRAVVERTPVSAEDREFIFDVLLARENTSTTAIGEGIAIPHVRHPVIASGAPAVSLSYLRSAVAFGALDGEPVGTVFMLVTPTVKAHLHLLARLARALHDPGFRAALERRAGLEELVAEAARVEASLAAANGSGAEPR
jgi:PTS system nitrogen regulatory IIA component